LKHEDHLGQVTIQNPESLTLLKQAINRKRGLKTASEGHSQLLRYHLAMVSVVTHSRFIVEKIMEGAIVQAVIVEMPKE
jgi:hypothetical protein